MSRAQATQPPSPSAAASAQAGATAPTNAHPRTRQGPAWLRDVREAAAAVVDKNAADPALALARRAELRVADQPGSVLTPADIAPHLFDGEGARFVFVDGLYVPSLGNADLHVRGAAAATNLAHLLAGPPSQAEAVEEHLNRHADPDAPLTALSILETRDGFVLELAPGAVVPQPIHLLFLHSGQPNASAAHPRILALAGGRAQATVVEQHAGLGTAASLTNAVVEVVASEGAHVRWLKLQREGLRGDHFASFHARQARDSAVDTFALMVGGHEVRNQLVFHLEGEGATCSTDGLFLGAGHQRITVRTDIEHSVPHTTSTQLWKGILDGNARGSFTGNVIVRPDAQKTNAQQTNRNLLLSDHALVASTPQLEIHADDVKCAHGSSIGRLDADALFFLRSRGLDAEAARLLMTQAFAREALDRVTEPGLRTLLDGLVNAWFVGRRDLGKKGWPE